MSEEQLGEKTEEPSQKKLDDAHKKGQFAKSTEIQTVFVLFAGLMALLFSTSEIYRHITSQMISTYSNLHHAEITLDSAQLALTAAAGLIFKCIWPVTLATLFAGILAGGLQSRFQFTPEVLELNFEKLHPIKGFKKVFSLKQMIPTSLGAVKLLIIVALTYSVIKGILKDPIFYSPVNVERIAVFLASSAYKIVLRICLLLVVIAFLDYLYQRWKTNEDLKMTRQELKDETKNQEGNPEVKAQRRRMKNAKSQRDMIADLPQADAVITNPTRLAIAIRYDRKASGAPVILAKGARKFAQKIREEATKHQIPIIENKPLARLMFKYGRVGGEIPAELYSAVAEILAYVYRINAYRYYRESN